MQKQIQSDTVVEGEPKLETLVLLLLRPRYLISPSEGEESRAALNLRSLEDDGLQVARLEG